MTKRTRSAISVWQVIRCIALRAITASVSLKPIASLIAFADTMVYDKGAVSDAGAWIGAARRHASAFHPDALAGDHHICVLITKIIERRGVLLRLHLPTTATLQIIEGGGPTEETGIDRIGQVTSSQK